jgi:phage repressor protein C with HTH and peptisase S24 domain
VEPKTPLGRRLREVRGHLGEGDREAFAAKLGIGKSALAYYERGERVPDASALAPYFELFGINLSWLITGEGDMVADASRAPRKPLVVDPKTIETLQATVDTIAEAVASQAPSHRPKLYAPRRPATLKYFPTMQVSAGAGRAVLAESDGEDLDAEGLASRLLGIEPKHLYIFPVKGDSMFPTLDDGDIAVVDRRYQEIDQGMMYVASINGELVVKRALRDGNKLSWVSDNESSAYPSIDLEGEAQNATKVLGKVVWCWKRV